MYLVHLAHRRGDRDEMEIRGFGYRISGIGYRESDIGNRESGMEKAEVFLHEERCLVVRVTQVRTIVVEIEIGSAHILQTHHQFTLGGSQRIEAQEDILLTETLGRNRIPMLQHLAVKHTLICQPILQKTRTQSGIERIE